MLKVSELMQIDVYRPKRKDESDPAKLGIRQLSLVGQVRQVVFTPKGDRAVGMLVRRPDVAGMVKRDDVFIALDAVAVGDHGLVATKGDESFDAAARERLGLDWDTCLLWTGMDAKTTDGKELGWISDVEFYPKSGKVKAFYVGDGSVAKSLVGDVVIPGEMLRGYRDGYLLVDPKAAGLALNGGLAARAGEGYARAKHEGKEAVSKAGAVAGSAVEKGAYELGRAIGKAKRAVADTSGDAKPAGSSAKSSKSKGAKSGGTKKKGAAYAVGKRIGRTKGMFGAFVDEYKKASK